MAEYEGRREVRVRPIRPGTNQCYLKVVTRNDPASNVITITCNGLTFTSGSNLTMTAYGHAWYGEVVVTGLTELRYYDWTVTQGSFTDTGTCNRLPVVGEQHAVVLYSCDNNTNLSNQNNGNPQTVAGLWPKVKALLDSGVFISMMVGVDDYSGYADSKVIVDDYNANSSGLSAAASILNGGNANDASLAWLAYAGCLGTSDTVTEGDLTVNKDLICHWGRESNRLYCGNRIPFEKVDGDHEFLPDIGYDTNVQLGSNPRWATYPTVAGEGQIAIDNMVDVSGKTICNSGTNDANAAHQVIRAGNIRLISTDQACNATGGIGSNNSIPSVQMTTVFGTNQISDIKAEVASEVVPFNLLLMTCGHMYLADGITSGNSHLAQHPLYNHCTAEYEALISNDTDGLMTDPGANGALGVMVAVSGDLHRRNVLRYENAAYTGNIAMKLEHWHTGTINGSSNFGNSTGLSVGDSYENGGNVGTAAASVKATVLNDDDDTETKRFSFILVEDLPAGKPVMRMTNYSTDQSANYSRDYTPGKSNLSNVTGLQYKQMIGVSE